MTIGTGYENAPATRMLATHCAACGRPLLDAKSVEIGMGPDCRKRLGFNLAVSEEARAEANALVYQIALDQGGTNVADAAKRLAELGFAKLAAKIVDRVCPVRITQDASNGSLRVKAPYADAFVAARRNVPGSRWDADAKETVFPGWARRELWTILQACYRGTVAMGPKGAFVL